LLASCVPAGLFPLYIYDSYLANSQLFPPTIVVVFIIANQTQLYMFVIVKKDMTHSNNAAVSSSTANLPLLAFMITANFAVALFLMLIYCIV